MVKRYLVFALLVIGLGIATVPVSNATQDTARILDENSDQTGIASNPLYVRDIFLEIALGNISGKSSDNKFARNIEIDSGVTADLWDGGHTVASGGVSLIWVQPTQARVHQLVSTSTDDDGSPVGIGARTVRVFYLPDWDTAQTSTDTTMNGTTDVALPSLVMINRMQVLTKGTNTPNAGIITATADVDNTITSQIRAGQGQTQQSMVGIPSTQNMFLGRLYGNINKSAGAAGSMDINLCVNPEPADETVNCRIAHTFGLMTGGTSALTINYATWKKIEGPALTKMQGVSGANDLDLSGGYDFIVVDK